MIARRNLLINVDQTVPVHIARVTAFGGIAEHPGAQRGMAPVGGNQKIAFRLRAVGKPDADAVVIFFAAGNAFAELHGVAAPEVEHFTLQFGAGHRAGAAAGA